jgi:peptidoglycan hydrolase-like protein with peptidoglycan-binding domain
MRNALRRIAFGVLGTGMVVTMAAGAATVAASAAVAAPQHPARELKTLQWPAVKQGAEGNRARTIQYLLNERGYKVTIDSKFGPDTTAKVKDFQKAKGITPADGIVGDKTWPKLIITVKQGDKGDAVRAVQDYLKRAYGYTSLKVDGDFGAETTKAVKSFQKRYGIKDDGVVNEVTWNTLVVKAL